MARDIRSQTDLEPGAVSFTVMSSRPDPQEIRIGVMANGRTFPAWQADAIRRLQATPGVEIALLIVREGGLSGPTGLARLKDHGAFSSFVHETHRAVVGDVYGLIPG